jgi:hypothetical protein
LINGVGPKFTASSAGYQKDEENPLKILDILNLKYKNRKKVLALRGSDAKMKVEQRRFKIDNCK